MTTPKATLDELERLEKAASEAPWGCPGYGRVNSSGGGAMFYTREDADGRFIVAARNALPSLLADALRLAGRDQHGPESCDVRAHRRRGDNMSSDNMSTPALMFVVLGEPQTQGSMRAFTPKGWTRPVLTSTNKALKPWRATVAETALAHGWGGDAVDDGPVALKITFTFCRPASHYGKQGLKLSAPPYPHTGHGDLDKLVRAVGDALTGIVWRDDRRIVACSARKEWGMSPGAKIHIKLLQPIKLS